MPEQQVGEWLETDGLGGFATGPARGPRTRRYHAILSTAALPPAQRVLLVAGFDAWITLDDRSIPLTEQLYQPGVTHPTNVLAPTFFEAAPWPRSVWDLSDAASLLMECFMVHGKPMTVLRFQSDTAESDLRLSLRPYLAFRDIHSLQHEDANLHLEDVESDGARLWSVGPEMPTIRAVSNGAFNSAPDWYRSFLYEEERGRGFDHVEDLLSPGTFTWKLTDGPACLMFSAEQREVPPAHDVTATVERLRTDERNRRETLGTALDQAADTYIVSRGEGRTIVAGYPWFTDWGRDTFIALRGLCLCTNRLWDAWATITEWSRHVSQGMLPNRFPDDNPNPQYNSVDAALWFVVMADEVRRACETLGTRMAATDEQLIDRAIQDILSSYARGTRHGIRADDDGLLCAGAPGTQLTWMDACSANEAVTPRVGKPVEIQALWINALHAGRHLSQRYQDLELRALSSFRERFPDPQTGGLLDVVDADHVPGQIDDSVRPNQIFAVGGLRFPLIEGDAARRIVDLVEERLWTPLGLRSLDPADPRYCGTYTGTPEERDAAYHQGTAWTWLLGPFIEAWVRVRGSTDEAKIQARKRFLEPLLARANPAAPGHFPEIADGDAPHHPRGCPFQAWSVGEILRLERDVLSPDPCSWEQGGPP